MRSDTRIALLQVTVALGALIVPAAATWIPRTPSCINPLGRISLDSDSSTFLGLDHNQLFEIVDDSQATTFQLNTCGVTDPSDIFDISIKTNGLGTNDFLGVAGTTGGLVNFGVKLVLAPVAQGANGAYHNALIPAVDGKQTMSTIWRYEPLTGVLSAEFHTAASNVILEVAGSSNLSLPSGNVSYVGYTWQEPAYNLTWIPQPAEKGEPCGGSAFTGSIKCDAKLACIANHDGSSTCQSLDSQSCQQSTSDTQQGSYKQCGGLLWPWWAPRQCNDGWACIEENGLYSNCLPLDANSINPCSTLHR